jgi:hypothetical protein
MTHPSPQRRPRGAVPFSDIVNCCTTGNGEFTPRIEVAAGVMGESQYIAIPSSAQRRPRRAVPFGDSVPCYTTCRCETPPRIKVPT